MAECERDSIMALVCGFWRAICPRSVPSLLVLLSESSLEVSRTQGMWVHWRNGWLEDGIPVVRIPSGLAWMKLCRVGRSVSEYSFRRYIMEG